MTLLHPEKVGVYAIEIGDFDHQSAPGVVIGGMHNIGFNGYYSFNGQITDPNPNPIPYFPSFWDPADCTTAKLDAARANGRLVIGFNEPWNSFGSFRTPVTPTQALDAWPLLMGLGNRLASPSISGPTDGNDWLAQFMAGVSSRGYRVDVINVHYYGGLGASIADFQGYLASVHSLYNLPIIVTEWARANWANDAPAPNVPSFTYADQLAWAEAGLNMMDSLSYVEMSFWYAATIIFGTWQNMELMLQDGTLTPVGLKFQTMLGGSALPPPPPPPPDPTGPSLRKIMNASGVIINPDNGTTIPLPPFGLIPRTLSAICNATGINRR